MVKHCVTSYRQDDVCNVYNDSEEESDRVVRSLGMGL
jgi:hypothetical protein